MEVLALSLVAGILSSIITTKILATYYFKIVDGYVEDMINKTKEFVEAMIRKHG